MADYDIGYGKPPRHTQFKPGQSGNPKGKPRGAKGLKAELREELDERVPIPMPDGKQKRVTKRRLVIKTLVAKAAKGSVPAADKLIALMIKAEGLEDERPPERRLSETDELILRRFLGEDGTEGAAPWDAPDE
jgi:hypothetical protein